VQNLVTHVKVGTQVVCLRKGCFWR